MAFHGQSIAALFDLPKAIGALDTPVKTPAKETPTKEVTGSKVGNIVARFEGLRGNSAPCARKPRTQRNAIFGHPLAPYFARWWRSCQRCSSRPSLGRPARPSPLQLPQGTLTSPHKGSARARAAPPVAMSMSSPSKRPLSPSMRTLPSPSRCRAAAEVEAAAAAAAALWGVGREAEQTPEPRGSRGGLLAAPGGSSTALQSGGRGESGSLRECLSDAQAACQAMGNLLAEVEGVRNRLTRSMSDAQGLLASEAPVAQAPTDPALERRLAEAERRLAEADAEREAWLAQREAMEVELQVLRAQVADHSPSQSPPSTSRGSADGIDDLARAAGAFLRARAGRGPASESAGPARQGLVKPTLGEFSMHCDDEGELEEESVDALDSPTSLVDEYEAMDVLAAASILCGRGGPSSPDRGSTPQEPEGEPSEASSRGSTVQHLDRAGAVADGGAAAISSEESLPAQLAAAQQAVHALAAAREHAMPGSAAASEAAVFGAVGQLLGKCHELCRLCRQTMPEEAEKGNLRKSEELSHSLCSTEASLFDAARVVRASAR